MDFIQKNNMDRKNRKLSYVKLMLFILCLGLFSVVTFAQTIAADDCIYVEAKEWNKKHPELAKWKKYPSRTVDCLKSIPDSPDKVNKYGSWGEKPIFKATGYFYARKYDKRWILVDPDGYLHIETAVVGIRQGKGETNKTYFNKKFENEYDWINKTINLLTSNGFNGAGAWSDDKAIQQYNQISHDKKFSYCPMLNLMAGYGKSLKVTRQLSGNIGYPNQCIMAFDPDFEAYCEREIPKMVSVYKDDPNVFGYFSDNELPISKNNLEGYLKLPENNFGRKAAEEWMKDKGITNEEITDELRSEFAGYVADRYYSIVNRILKKYDSHHLYLGSRLHGSAKFIKEVVQAAGNHCDIISFNYYGFWTIRKEDIKKWEIWVDKPFIITEFYTKAEDSGLTNVTGAGWEVRTQKDRGIHYENFIINLLESNNCVGWSWFRYQDNDPTAKGVDPSNLNANKGCVDNSYEPYDLLISSMKKVNTIKYGLMKQFADTFTIGEK